MVKERPGPLDILLWSAFTLIVLGGVAFVLRAGPLLHARPEVRSPNLGELAGLAGLHFPADTEVSESRFEGSRQHRKWFGKVTMSQRSFAGMWNELSRMMPQRRHGARSPQCPRDRDAFTIGMSYSNSAGDQVSVHAEGDGKTVIITLNGRQRSR